MSERSGSAVSWLALGVSGLSLIVSAGIAGLAVSVSWVATDAEAGRASLALCSDFRAEVLDLHDRGLSPKEIESVLNAAVVSALDDQPAYEVIADECGTIESVVEDLRGVRSRPAGRE